MERTHAEGVSKEMHEEHTHAAPHGTTEQTTERNAEHTREERVTLRQAFVHVVQRVCGVWRVWGARPAGASARHTGPANAVLAPDRPLLSRESLLLLSAPAAILLALSLAATIGAPAASAQEEGGGDAIQQTLTNVRNYLAALSFSVGGIGFVASMLVKGYASINENAHAYAAMGMKGSLWCIVAGVIVTPILSIAAGLAGGA
jgi:hypothetical protein